MGNVAIEKVTQKATTPLAIFEELERRMEEVQRRAFELFEKRGSQLSNPMEDWLQAEREVLGWPAAELSEVDSRYEVSVTLPGFDPKDVQVSVTPSEIVVHAKSETEKKSEDKKRIWSEFGSSEIYRKFTLPEEIDTENTKASLDNGMLHISAAKAHRAEAAPSQVPVA